MATKKERQRELARQAYERRLDRQARRTKRTRQTWVASIAALLVVGIGTGSAALAGVFQSKSKTPAASASASASPSASASAGPSAMVGGKCVYTASGTAARTVSLPPASPDTTATYTATMTTNRGAIVINMLNTKAPCTVNSFVSLADQKYFDNTSCHRLTTTGIYVLQCGDPTGTGSGGPGYQFGDENLKGATYPTGTVAMANAGAGTNGSQFFLVYKDSPLPANYTPFGTITSGLSVLQAVAAAGSDNSNAAGDGKPKESVQIESMTISKT